MYRLIYKSESVDILDWEQIREILNHSEQNNEHAGITGTLLATEHHFLQVIEGKYEEVNKLFMTITHDKRHTNIQLISFDLIDCRLFAGWGMKGLGLFDVNSEQVQALQKKYGSRLGELKLPLENWQALSLINDLNMMKGLPDWKRH